jgi:ABC-2 type transport system permease protein
LPLRNRPWVWLLRKEWQDLMTSRSWWVFLILMGPLVGVSFISAVRTYAEVSGLGGSAAGVGEAFSPLIGVWAPTFSACEIAAAFLLPFVAIRVVAGDKQSGALTLEAQHPMSAAARILAKAVVLFLGWFLALLAPFAAVLLWKSYGGSIYPPELLTVAAGHLLNAALIIALASAAAAMVDHPSTAAIVTLAVTVGTWILTFIAAVNGGIWERIVGYTPTAVVAQFQHGLIRLDVVLIAAVLIATGLLLAAIWIRIGISPRRRAYESLTLAAVAMVAIFACSFVNASWDTSENRMNSFSRADEQALRQIRAPLEIEVHLAPEDPRRVDFERRVLSKLIRVVPRVEERYVSATSIGLFEQSSPHYGEIWYRFNGREAMTRATTPESALETIYPLAGISPPPENDADIFRGHPLTSPPKGAAIVFYILWPALVATFAFLVQRRKDEHMEVA